MNTLYHATSPIWNTCWVDLEEINLYIYGGDGPIGCFLEVDYPDDWISISFS